MDYSMDVYLSRRLKNWAARRSPPASSRETLLQLAALEVETGQEIPVSYAKKSSERDSVQFYPVLSLYGSLTLKKFWPPYLNPSMLVIT
jgi:hypothetical protein